MSYERNYSNSNINRGLCSNRIPLLNAYIIISCIFHNSLIIGPFLNYHTKVIRSGCIAYLYVVSVKISK